MNKSVKLSLGWRHSSLMKLFITISLTCCVLKSMSFPLAEICLLVASELASLLSIKTTFQWNIMSLRRVSLLATSSYNLRVQVIFFLHSDKKIYSDSAEFNAMPICLLVHPAICVQLMVIA